MNLKKPLFAIAAIVALGAIAACDQSAPPTPEDTPGPAAQSSALNGTYNLLESNCGDVDSDKSLVIDGNKFLFPGATCTIASSERQVNQTRVTLACEGSPAAGNRVVNLQSRPGGVLRVNEGSITLTYYQCMKADSSTSAMVGRAL